MLKKAPIDYFDFLLADFVNAPASHYEIRARQCLKVFERHHGGKPAKVLEIGSGIGGVVPALRRMGIPAFGMEPSSSAVRYAGKTYGDYYWEHALGDAVSDAERQRYGGCDFIAAFEVFPMFPYEDYAGYLTAVADLLAPGGVFLMMIANYSHPYLHPFLSYSDPYTQSRVTPESLYRLSRTVPDLKLLQITRWNSASREIFIKIRTAFQVVGETILSKITPFIFQTPRSLNPEIQSVDLFLSSHIAAVFRNARDDRRN